MYCISCSLLTAGRSLFKTGLAEVEYKFSMLSGGYSFENKNSTSTEKNRKYKTNSFVKYIINKYTN